MATQYERVGTKLLVYTISALYGSTIPIVALLCYLNFLNWGDLYGFLAVTVVASGLLIFVHKALGTKSYAKYLVVTVIFIASHFVLLTIPTYSVWSVLLLYMIFSMIYLNGRVTLLALFYTLCVLTLQFVVNPQFAHVPVLDNVVIYAICTMCGVGGIAIAQVGRRVIADSIHHSKRSDQVVESLRSILSGVAETTALLASSSEELTASAEQSAAAAEHTAVIMQQLAEGTEEQVHSINETDQTVKHLSASAQQIASRAESVSHASDQAFETAREGNRSIHKVIEQMQAIREEASRSSVSLHNLSDHALQIGAIVETITGIASQTNLLALNAAIEAARAGEQGRGFSVVADEVRKLAEQSSQSAQQISTYIQTIQQEIQSSVDSMTRGMEEVVLGIEVVNVAGASFEQIQNAVQEVTAQIQEVSSQVQQISSDVEHVSLAVDRIKEVTFTTASGTQTVSASSQEQLASMEEITSSAAALSELAEQLEEMMTTFQTGTES